MYKTNINGNKKMKNCWTCKYQQRGGITLLVDVNEMPDNSFGYVPTPALVAPIEFSLSRGEYIQLGGYDDRVRSLLDVIEKEKVRSVPWQESHPWPINGADPKSNKES